MAEARDVHLGAARLGLESYAAQIIPKTATLFGFALEAAAHLNADNRCEAFRLLGESIGEIYQLSNDYYDLQPEALKARHSPLDYWCETASFPIVVFADLHPYELVPIESLGKSLSYSEWEALLALIWQDDVREFCQAHMAEKVKCATTLAREMSLPDALYDLCCSIIEQVQDSTFWFNVYEE